MLEGIRVADMSTVIFGPYSTQILADLGADVIKIEPADGDVLRFIGKPAHTKGMGTLHMTLNRGKRSVAWDMRSEQGREAMRRLLESSDVFVHNIRADAIKRLGLDYETVRKINPAIVYVHCTGFGIGGVHQSLAAYDDVIQAASGIASLRPRVDGTADPRYVPMAIADKVSGLHAAYATLAALIHKLRTGEGQHVEVPMFESVTSFTLVEHLSGGTFPDSGATMGYARQVDKERQPTRTKDGHIAVAPYTDERWVRFFEIAGRPDILEDERLSNPVARFKNGSLMQSKLAEITPEKTTAEWISLLGSAGIPVMRVNTLEDLLDDAHLKSVGMFTMREHPTEGRYVEVRPPVKFSARPKADISPAPLIGEHSAEVLDELERRR
jgi:crotonobetainyl-CoA:carnitine CoA-transferase CaiB-like acyl-CoA transferase